MTDAPLRAGIIGAGQIGWRYDGGRWDGIRSVSHAACLDRHPRTRLVAMLEPDASAREAASAALGQGVVMCAALEAFLAQGLDLVCIASPTALHARHVEAAARAGVRYLLIEKPVTASRSEFEGLLTLWAGLSDPPRTFVNYFRRGLPQVAALREACRTRPLLGLDFAYSRGLAVNGVHLVDLCGYLLGAERAPELAWVDARGGDNPSFAMHWNGIAVTFRGHALPYHCIETRATFADGRLSLLEGGLRYEWEPCLPNPAYPGFFRLGPAEPAMDPAVASRAFLDGTYASLCALLDDDRPSASPLQGSAFAQEVLDLVLSQGTP